MQPGLSFLNFDPKPELIAYKKKILNRIWEMSPSDATLEGCVESITNGFRARLKLTSRELRYAVDEKHSNPKEALEKAAAIMMNRIHDWYHGRQLKQR